jgi:hypothetical protein
MGRYNPRVSPCSRLCRIRGVYEQACTLSLTLALAVSRWSAPIYSPFTNKDTFYRRLGGGGKNIWTFLQKNSHSPGFDPRIVQFVASRHTDWAIRAHICKWAWVYRSNNRHNWEFTSYVQWHCDADFRLGGVSEQPYAFIFKARGLRCTKTLNPWQNKEKEKAPRSFETSVSVKECILNKIAARTSNVANTEFSGSRHFIPSVIF